MEVQHKSEGSKGMFSYEKGGKVLAEMTYSMAGKTRMIIDHTHVEDELRGQKAGLQLLHKAVEYARENALEILPLCPFAAAMFKKHEEIQDVLR
ncbi:MAG: GNAT family N-acetyltransferase [Fluviicola sp.]